MIAATVIGHAPSASATTLAEALALAYANNPQLNAARAGLRATDEGVPEALSGYRPTVTGTAEAAVEDNNRTGTTYPRGVELSVQQTLFRGFRTKNSVKGAETAVLAGRENLRNTEQSVLLSGVTAFMDVASAQAILSLRSQNLEFLREQVRAANDRLSVGEGTRTDVAETNSSLAQGLFDYAQAAANLATANATYLQVIGRPPDTIGAIKSVDAFLPRTEEAAIAKTRSNHPANLAAQFNVDSAAFNVKVIEGEFLPTVTVEGDLTHQDGTVTGTSNTAAIIGRLSVPIYQAGAPDARTRAAKETLGQQRIILDQTRDSTRQQVVSAWASLDAARSQIEAADAQVAAQTLALQGVIEERNVGQRTTLDVLNAQQDLINARIAQVTARRDRVTAAYSLLAAVGDLSATRLSLAVNVYNPTTHYRQVRDKWGGLRTPDGR